FHPPPTQTSTLFPYTTLFRSNLMLQAVKNHRITYVGRCAADSEEARIAPAFLREHNIEPILVHDPVPAKSGLGFYARLCANLFRSEEHTSELQSRFDLVCRLL